MNNRNRGAASCFVIGCIGTIVVVVAGVAALIFGGRYFISQIIEEYTDDEPLAFEEVTLTEADYKEVSDRIQAFATALEEGTETEPLELSAEELNSALIYEEDFNEFGKYFRISIEDGMIAGSLSLPLRELDIGMGLNDRYLNGKGVFDVYIRDGRLYAHAKSFEVKGEPLPDQIMNEIQNENLVKEMDRGGDTRATVRKLEAIEIGDDTIRLIPKPVDERPVDAEDFDDEELVEVDV